MKIPSVPRWCVAVVAIMAACCAALVGSWQGTLQHLEKRARKEEYCMPTPQQPRTAVYRILDENGVTEICVIGRGTRTY